MDDRGGDKLSEQMRFESVGFGERTAEAPPGGQAGPTWRAWVLSIVAAVILSVAATLLLGGSFRLRGASNGAAGGCVPGSGSPCCPPQGERPR